MSPRLDLPFAAGLAAGAVLAMALPSAPHFFLLCAVLGGVVLGWLFWPRGRLLFGMGVGFAWAALVAMWVMEARLPAALEGQALQITGRVMDLPEVRSDSVRFRFRIDQGEAEAAQLVGEHLRLSWYRTAVIPEPGSDWQLTVRLKRPRGSLNPGGFDFERYALEQRLIATGYVVTSSENKALASGQGINLLRHRLSNAIAESVDASSARFVQALAVGDVRGLNGKDWHVLRATGIAHLIAISGLHVGLVAGFGALLMRLTYRVFPRLGLRVPLPQIAALAALLAAFGYTALAGFELPTVRTLLMIAAALLAILLRRVFDPVQAFSLALIAVVMFDPLAVLNAGFWLSFLGVAWLMWCMPRAYEASAWRTLVSAQAVMTVGLLPLTVWFFGQASIAGPICNLLAVPWVSFVVVPLALAGTLLELMATGAGLWLFQCSAWLMQGLWLVLEPVAALHGALVYLPEPSTLAFTLGMIGAFILLLPRAMPGKVLAMFLFLPLVFPSRETLEQGEVIVSVLDVGQGLSVLVRTSHHAVLVDAGPAFPGGLNMGEAAVVPALRALGVTQLDWLVISHGDNDHAGGAEAVKLAYSPQQISAARKANVAGESPCLMGEIRHFDGLRFELLHPPLHLPYLGNDSSCVLKISEGDTGLVLLPGDIGKWIETRLVREHAEALPAPLLVMPHHGSLTSSSESFIEAVSPSHAVIGSGYRNRFGLPREEVVNRYLSQGIAVSDTARDGAVHYRLSADGVLAVMHEREMRPRLWRER